MELQVRLLPEEDQARKGTWTSLDLKLVTESGKVFNEGGSGHKRNVTDIVRRTWVIWKKEHFK